MDPHISQHVHHKPAACEAINDFDPDNDEIDTKLFGNIVDQTLLEDEGFYHSG